MAAPDLRATRRGISRKRAVTTDAGGGSISVGGLSARAHQEGPSGDFTWKDPAAANRAGMSLQDYVIGGIDPTSASNSIMPAGRWMRPAFNGLFSARSVTTTASGSPLASRRAPAVRCTAEAADRRIRPWPRSGRHRRDGTGARSGMARRQRREIWDLPSDPGPRSGAYPASKRLAQDRDCVARGPASGGGCGGADGQRKGRTTPKSPRYDGKR